MAPRWGLSVLMGALLAASVLAGCGSTSEQGEQVTVTRSFSDETDMYRVTIEEQERNGQCIRRRVLFTSHNRLYVRPHVDRVRAVDQGCDAIYTSEFEEFAILRSPRQQDRYQSSFSFRNRINEDLWYAYLTAVFNDQRKRRAPATST